MPTVAHTQEDGAHVPMTLDVQVARRRSQFPERNCDLEIRMRTGRKGRGSSRTLLLTAHEARKLAYGILTELERAGDEERERIQQQLNSKSNS